MLQQAQQTSVNRVHAEQALRRTAQELDEARRATAKEQQEREKDKIDFMKVLRKEEGATEETLQQLKSIEASQKEKVKRMLDAIDQRTGEVQVLRGEVQSL
eukprot:1219624-Amphidinium_carterae.3